MLTRAQATILAAYLRNGHHLAAATQLGLALSTVRNGLSAGYAALGVHNAIEAARVLGWLVVPDEPAAKPPAEPAARPPTVPTVTLRRVDRRPGPR